MVVGVDIRVLAKGERGGIPEYTRQLLRHLIPLDPRVQYKLFFSARRRTLDFACPWPNARLFAFRYPNRYLLTSMAFGWGPKLDRLIGGVDVWWSPHMLPVSLSPDTPLVLTVHDLSFLMFPELLSARRRAWHHLLRPRRQFVRADKIIAPSHSTKDDLVRLLRIVPERINVIYSGITAQHPISPSSYDAKYTYPLLLFLGVLEPRKNIVGLLVAFELVKEHLQRARSPLAGIPLFMAGARGWHSSSVMGALSRSPWRADSRLIGFVEEGEKQALLKRSIVFIYPSFLEGFGFPPLEAMSQGVPVVAGANSSLAELLGDAALLVDPCQPRELAQAILSLLEDESLREELGRRGRERALRYSWQDSAQKTLGVLKAAARR